MNQPAGGHLFECEVAARDVVKALEMVTQKGVANTADVMLQAPMYFPVSTVKVHHAEQRSDDPGRVTECRHVRKGTIYCVTVEIPDNITPDMMMSYVNGFTLADWMARGLFVAYHRAKQLYLIDRKSSKELDDE